MDVSASLFTRSPVNVLSAQLPVASEAIVWVSLSPSGTPSVAGHLSREEEEVVKGKQEEEEEEVVKGEQEQEEKAMKGEQKEVEKQEEEEKRQEKMKELGRKER